MFNNIDKFEEYYDSLGVKYERFKGALWLEERKMIVPIGPVKTDYSLSNSDERLLLHRFPSAFIIRYTDGFEDSDNKCKEYYSVICDKFTELEEMTAKNRYKIRNSLKNCDVERVDANYLAEHGYNVYASAFKRYADAGTPIYSEHEFKKELYNTEHYEDIFHYWGVFHKNILIAYAVNIVFEHIEVLNTTIKLQPDFLKLRPSYALFHTMDHYYLKEMNYEYTNTGYKHILYKTKIHDFLIGSFNYKKASTNLCMRYKYPLFLFQIATFPMRKIIGKFNSRLAVLYELEDIRKKCHSVKKQTVN